MAARAESIAAIHGHASIGHHVRHNRSRLPTRQTVRESSIFASPQVARFPPNSIWQGRVRAFLGRMGRQSLDFSNVHSKLRTGAKPFNQRASGPASAGTLRRVLLPKPWFAEGAAVTSRIAHLAVKLNSLADELVRLLQKVKESLQKIRVFRTANGHQQKTVQSKWSVAERGRRPRSDQPTRLT